MLHRTHAACTGLVAMLSLCLPVQAGIVISQVYGGGGNSGSIYKNDFIELFNADTVAISLSGWTVQYAATTGTTWQSTPLTGTLQPGQFLLVKEATGVGGTTDLPAPDVTGTLNLSSISGKVALVSSAQLQSGPCPTASVIDFVGYGVTTDCYEGSAAAPAPSNILAAARINACFDTDQNSVDFQTASPAPRNTASFSSCAAIGFAVVQFPPSTALTPCGSTASAPIIYGRVYVAGATDADAQAAPGMLAQVGVGPSGSDPASASGWAWVNAIPNPGYDFSQNDDEYEQRIGAHASVPFDYAYRWSYYGQSFVYADTGNGTTDGYSTANAGKLTADGDVIYCDRFDNIDM